MRNKNEKLIILLIDFLTINLAWVIFFFFRVQSGMFDLIITPQFFFPMLVVYFYWLLLFMIVGLYRTWFALSRFDEISSLFKVSFVGIFILFFLIFFDDYQHGIASASRILIFIYWFLFLLLVGTGRIFVRSLQRNLLIQGYGRKKAVVIGFNEKAIEVNDEISQIKALGLDVIGFISTDQSHLDKQYKGKPVIGHVSDIEQLLEQYQPQEVIIAIDNKDQDLLVDIISKCENKNVGLKIVPDLYEILSGQARTAQLYGMPLIDVMPELMPEWEKRLKRVFDIVMSLIILIITFPVCVIVALAIKIDSKGPVFFIQERCGLNGDPFNMIKFRSMRQDAEKLSGPVWSTKDDPRITKVGKFIRKVRLDEIPQLINVLKGEMSIVGPRPERPFFVEKLAHEIPYYKRRLKVRPGLTGWAQIKHKYDETIEDVKTKLKYDLFYIENMSIRMDFKILFRTIFVVLFGKGHYN
jgi:exopolysaccharide biosynthesis polyprenyl glycosylphosphotransferase